MAATVVRRALPAAAALAVGAGAALAQDGPPGGLPPDASFGGGAVTLATSALSLPDGFGVGTAAGPAVPGAVADLPTARLAPVTTVTALTDETGPPAALPAGATFGTGAPVTLGTGTSVAFGAADIGFGQAAVAAGLAGADLAGVDVREEAGGYRFTLGADVLFDFDEASLRPEADPVLRELVRQVGEQLPGASYRVEGHTDAKGSDAYNDRLSDRRARSVRDWLARRGGVPASRIGTAGLGERSPVAPNERPDGSDDPEGRQRNRRVEILVTPAS